MIEITFLDVLYNNQPFSGNTAVSVFRNNADRLLLLAESVVVTAHGNYYGVLSHGYIFSYSHSVPYVLMLISRNRYVTLLNCAVEALVFFYCVINFLLLFCHLSAQSGSRSQLG